MSTGEIAVRVMVEHRALVGSGNDEKRSVLKVAVVEV
jgi:hypothetical protein